VNADPSRWPVTTWTFLIIAVVALVLVGGVVYRVTDKSYRLRVSLGTDRSVEIAPAH
jgi:uncharacterized membrane-anchored protein YhcB (DUF1043 family)